MDIEKPKKKYNYIKKPGRPTKYSLQLAAEICDAIATSQLGLQHLCDANPHWPERARIFGWRRKYEEFRLMYDKAKEDQTEVSVEYMQEVMNEPHHYIDRETGQMRVDVSMLRLKMDTMKWHTAKLKPRKFGDNKQTIEDNQNIEAQKAFEHEKKLEEEYKRNC